MHSANRPNRSSVGSRWLPAFALAAVLGMAASRDAAASTTQVFSTDFEAGLPAQFTAPGCVIEGVQGYAGLGPSGHTFGGNFLHYTSVPLYPTTLLLTGLPVHDTVGLDFLLGVIDSWDGTELLQVRVDGALLFNHWFQLASGDSSDYIAPPGVLLSRGTDLGFSSGGYYFHDRAYDFTGEPIFHAIPHTASTLTVEWSIGAVSGPAADQWQGGTDESWAIDGVRVAVNNSTAGVGPAAAPQLALAGVFPNPSGSGDLTLRFTLPSAATAQLELLDVQGRRAFQRDVSALGAGSHDIDVRGDVRLAPGVYSVLLTQGGVVRSCRAVILH